MHSIVDLGLGLEAPSHVAFAYGARHEKMLLVGPDGEYPLGAKVAYRGNHG